MDYNNLTKDQLINMIEELKILNKELLKEKEQEAKLDFSWTGNLGHWYWNVKYNKVTFNPLKITTLGYTEEEIPEIVDYQFFTEKLHPEDYGKAMDAMKSHLSGESPVYELEYRIKAKDGYYKWYYDRGKITQYDCEGKPLFLSGIVFDITERKEQEMDIKEKNKILFKQSITDELTSLKNRRSIMEYLSMEVKMKFKNKEPLSIAIFDIDDFSKVNDNRGHNIGDKVLIQVANIMTKSVRDTDFVGRYGGEEFIVIYPKTKLKDAIVISERIRRSIEEYCFEDNCNISISGGVYEYHGEPLKEFINMADENLYKAKKQGKNRIISE